jgi:hypothetical protein
MMQKQDIFSFVIFFRLKVAENQAENSEMNIQRLNIRYCEGQCSLTAKLGIITRQGGRRPTNNIVKNLLSIARGWPEVYCMVSVGKAISVNVMEGKLKVF